MINFLICLIISVMLSYGMAILLSEKGNDYPIRKFRIYLQLFIHKIHWKMSQMLFCTVCTSFWTSLISDLIICIIAYHYGYFYFFFPFSGIITSGFVWTLMEYLNAQDKEQNINVFVDKTEK